MAVARSGAASVLLSNGNVLITGGDSPTGTLNTAEVMSNAGIFSSAAQMQSPRSGHTATTLQDGRVLITGGITTTGGGATNSAELYDPSANSWALVSGSMLAARSGHTASLLPDGRVLLAGGSNSGGPVSALEIFDPSSDSFSGAGVLGSPVSQHAAATLADGRVLIAGGSDGTNALATTYLFDPSSNSITSGPNLSTPRVGASATTLLDGLVLVAGGNDGSNDLASAEIYDAAANAFTPAPSNLSVPRTGHLAILLPNNNSVLILGGTSAGTDLASAELYLPWTGNFQATAPMSVPRPGLTASPLSVDGVLMAAGGSNLSSTELYGFATVKTDKADYAPGEIVTITGSGWQPGETVTLSFLESPLIDTHPNLTAVADSNGNISNNQFVPDAHDFGILFYLTAVGQTSARQAQTTFADNGNKSIFSDTDTTTETTTFGTIAANQCRNSFQVALQGSNRATAPVPPPATATFTSTPSGATFFAGSGCTGSAVTSVTVASGLTSASFSFRIPVVGTYTIKGVGSWDNGGSSNNASATVTVTQGTSTMSAAAATGTYGGTANLSATLTSGGAGVSGKTITFKLNGGTVGTATTDATGTATLSSASLTGPPKINAGTFLTGVSASFAGDASFTASSGTNTLTVNQKAITLTAATNSKGYDGATSAAATPTITAGGPLVSGDTANFTEVYSDKNVGAGNKTLIPSGTANDSNSGNNYAYTFVNNTTGTITARAITVTATTNSKTYDSNTTAAATPAVTTGTIAPGDTANFADTYDTKNVGTGKTLTPSGTVNDGNGGNNYAVTFANNTTGVVKTLAITVTAVASTKSYDGATTSTGVPTIAPALISPDTSNFLQTFDTRNAGMNKVLTPSGSANDGNGGNNYAVTFVNSTGIINPLAVTVTAVADTKTYDGGVLSTGTPMISPALISGDNPKFRQRFDTKNAGTGKTLIPTGSVLDGNNGQNYSVTFVNVNTGQIDKAALSITAVTNTKTYDGSNSAAANPTVSGLQPGDTVTGLAEVYDNKNAGSGKTLSVSAYTVNDGNSGGNYIVTTHTDTTGLINKAPLTVSATGVNKQYDGSPSATVTLSDNRVAGDVFSDSYTSAAFSDKNVGTTKNVSVSGISISGTDAPNYSLSNTTATITANITPRSLIVNATGVDKVYDRTTNATVTLSDNRVAGDVFTDSYTSASFADKKVANSKAVSVSGITINGADAGNYTFNTTASTTANITPLTITGSVTAANKVYDGTLAATITNRFLSGVISGDVVSYVGGTATFADKNVGTAKIVTATGLSLAGGDAGNYTVNSSATTTSDITPAPLTIKANNQTKAYGQGLPSLTATYLGLVPGDTPSSLSGTLVCTTTAVILSPVSGSPYPITCSGQTSTNYNITYTAGTLTVTQATTGVVIVSSANPSILNASVMFTATVSPQFSGMPTGTVTFKDGAISIGTGTVDGSGHATYSTSALAVNAHTITAVYGGDGNFTGNMSPAITQSVLYASGGMCGSDVGHEILQPINANRTGTIENGTSVWKQNATVPAKFRVCDVNGNSIGTPGVIYKFILYRVNSGTLANVDELTIDNSTNDLGWRFDGSQWIFNMSTKSAPINIANQTYYFRIDLNDGTSIYFNFGLK